jgi:hypothetical protein
VTPDVTQKLIEENDNGWRNIQQNKYLYKLVVDIIVQNLKTLQWINVIMDINPVHKVVRKCMNIPIISTPEQIIYQGVSYDRFDWNFNDKK